jgi:DNA-binding NarL/FixJ family response regulator
MSADKKLVFIVDDDPMQVQMMSDHLKESRKNFDVRGFATGEDAVDNMRNKPDIVILDYYLNTIDEKARNGAEILQFIKDNFPETEVVMVSGQDSMDVAVATMRFGATDYVVKGDSQFKRLDIAINRIDQQEKLQERIRYYKNLVNIMIAVMAIIIITTIVLSVMNKI